MLKFGIHLETSGLLFCSEAALMDQPGATLEQSRQSAVVAHLLTSSMFLRPSSRLLFLALKKFSSKSSRGGRDYRLKPRAVFSKFSHRIILPRPPTPAPPPVPYGKLMFVQHKEIRNGEICEVEKRRSRTDDGFALSAWFD